MKYDAEIGSGTMTYVPSFTEIGSGIQKLMGRGMEIHRRTDSMVIS
jgi:hypothetical protein